MIASLPQVGPGSCPACATLSQSCCCKGCQCPPEERSQGPRRPRLFSLRSDGYVLGSSSTPYLEPLILPTHGTNYQVYQEAQPIYAAGPIKTPSPSCCIPLAAHFLLHFEEPLWAYITCLRPSAWAAGIPSLTTGIGTSSAP